MGEALEYHLEYQGYFKDGYQNEYFQFRPGLEKFAREREYKSVDLANEYCAKVGKMLKGELGEGYVEWKSEDGKKQLQAKTGHERGRELWEYVLAEYHKQKDVSNMIKLAVQIRSHEPFRFLVLAPEFRSIIYAFYLEDNKNAKSDNDMRGRRERAISKKKRALSRIPMSGPPLRFPSPRFKLQQADKRGKMKRLFVDICDVFGTQ
ncbi:hypothetical protein EJ02DRAFT_428379 [Clathrospora elynae]|uniref:Uncharacterized protein n=1 Tax=Clathrospora elynae TaxID=706981 RepID=A0A6A5S7U6_9PLEO|nr:hypothetical protein EJ02DRAFT_428379 [Clathrospora elynae]